MSEIHKIVVQTLKFRIIFKLTDFPCACHSKIRYQLEVRSTIPLHKLFRELHPKHEPLNASTRTVLKFLIKMN